MKNSLIANAFTADHLAMLYVLGAQAAVSRDNARLYERLTAANQQLETYSRDLEGMTAEQVGKIFTPFTRLNQLNNDSHGLGLSIVERIVTKLGGTVGVESEVGVGTRFYFTLPVF